MRKLLLCVAAAGSVMAIASPAAAQWQRPGYDNAYHRGDAAPWLRQLQQIRFQRDQLARSGRLSRGEAARLDYDIRDTERSIMISSRNGIGPRQARNLDGRMTHLRNELARYSDHDGRRWNRHW